MRSSDARNDNVGAALIRPIRPLIHLRRFREANIDQRHLSTGDGFKAALERGADFARLFELFAVAVEGAIRIFSRTRELQSRSRSLRLISPA